MCDSSTASETSLKFFIDMILSVHRKNETAHVGVVEDNTTLLVMVAVVENNRIDMLVVEE